MKHLVFFWRKFKKKRTIKLPPLKGEKKTIFNKLFHVFKNKSNVYRVSILMFDATPTSESIMQSFIETCKKEGVRTNNFKVFNAQGNPWKLKNDIKVMLFDENLGLVFTIGDRATKSFKDFTLLLKNPPPCVFAGVKDPVKRDIIYDTQTSHNHFTGVQETTIDCQKQIDILRFIKPKVAQVLIVHEIDVWDAEKNLNDMYTALQKYNIKTKSLRIENKQEACTTIRSSLDSQKFDSLITLPHNAIQTNMAQISDLCSEKGITMMASDTSSIRKGPALAFGYSDEEFGIKAALLALDILINEKKPWELPIARITSKVRLHINVQVAKKQGLNIPSEIQNLIDVAEIYRENEEDRA